MLLSLQAQGTLGIVKDTAAEMSYCQLYEVRGSGLRAIFINDFEKVRQNYAEFAPTIPASSPKLGEMVLAGTAYGPRVHQTLPQEQWQTVLASPKLGEMVLAGTAYGPRVHQTLPQEQWQTVLASPKLGEMVLAWDCVWPKGPPDTTTGTVANCPGEPETW